MRILSHRRVHDGPVICLDVDDVEEPGGIHALREVVRHGDSVAALAVQEDGRLVLIRQYRYPAGQTLWEVPGGRLEAGESPETGAARELEEEAGVRPGSMERLCSFFTTPGFCDESVHLFRATRLAHVPPRPEADEGIETALVTLEEARAMAAVGEIREAKTLLALLLEERRRGW